MASVHWTVEMEEQMTKGDMKEVFMAMGGSEKSRNPFFTVCSKKRVRWYQMKVIDGSCKQKSSHDG